MKDEDTSRHVQPSTPRWVRCSLLLNAVVLTALLHTLIPFSFPIYPSSSPRPGFHECHPPLPPFLANKPPGAEPSLQKALRELDSVLQHRFDQGGIDSLSVAVVVSNGSLYEGFWGTRRANESDVGQDTTVNRHSIYRLASISKLFTAIETLVLRDRGVLKL